LNRNVPTIEILGKTIQWKCKLKAEKMNSQQGRETNQMRKTR